MIKKKKLSFDQRNQIYLGLIRRFGKDSQLNMCMEECGELISTINQYKRNRIDKNKVIEEIIDVMITANQVLYILGVGKDEFDDEYDQVLYNTYQKYDLRREGYYTDESFRCKDD